MSKDKLVDYDSTASGNLDVGGVSVAEGMLPSNVNNAIREQMSHLKDFADGTEAINALAVDNLRMDGNTISSTDTNGNITLAPDGTGVVNLTDNDKLTFGAGSDLQIYHDGSNSFIDDAGTGNLQIRASSQIKLQKYTGENMFVGIADGAASMYYDNSQKIATTSSGVNVTGELDAGNLTDALTHRFDSANGSVAYFTSGGTVGGGIVLGDSNSTANANRIRGEGNELTFYTNSSEAMRIDTSANVNVNGTVTSDGLSCDGAAVFNESGADRDFRIESSLQSNALFLNGGTSNVGINRAPSFEFDVGANDDGDCVIRALTGTNSGADAILRLQLQSTSGYRQSAIHFGDGADTDIGKLEYEHSDNSMRFTTNAAEAMRLTSGGDLEFRKNNTLVGSIYLTTSEIALRAAGGKFLTLNSGSSGYLEFFNSSYTGSPRMRPDTDDAVSSFDLGDSGRRFDDIYATNGTIQTSDQNEKQQIAALTAAEITAAKAISGLFKTFKWNDAVSEKGDAARTHAGVIAQDVEAAMTAAGLDAGDYAFFISGTWWETQTEVPAVEAVEAVDAVYEDVVIPAVLDDDGNEVEAERTEQRLISEAVEAVEAVAAYTRTDTYETAEEAPAGATERNRKGIRYPELLAFVGAATEQRLANIETRLAALEAS